MVPQPADPWSKSSAIDHMVDRLVDDSEDVKSYIGKCEYTEVSWEFEQGKITYGKFFWLKSPIFLAVTLKTYHKNEGKILKIYARREAILEPFNL